MKAKTKASTIQRVIVITTNQRSIRCWISMLYLLSGHLILL